MADAFTPEQRSRIMARVKNRDTKPELVVRSLLHRLGYRFRLHRKDLPGSPDIVLARYRTAIFIHGCFWHGHEGCPRAARPASNTAFWNTKLDRNLERDRRAQAELTTAGWNILIVWQCELRDSMALAERLQQTLSDYASTTQSH